MRNLYSAARSRQGTAHWSRYFHRDGGTKKKTRGIPSTTATQRSPTTAAAINCNEKRSAQETARDVEPIEGQANARSVYCKKEANRRYAGRKVKKRHGKRNHFLKTTHHNPSASGTARITKHAQGNIGSTPNERGQLTIVNKPTKVDTFNL